MSDPVRFAVPGVIALVAADGGLSALRIATPLARAEIHLLGAHVTRFQPAGHAELLWMSALSHFAIGKPIRGGIPICSPWFGPHASERSLPVHGFVRLRSWELVAVEQLSDGRVRAELRDRGGPQPGFPHDWAVAATITVGAELDIELATINTGAEPFTLGEAFHTYLGVGDVRRCTVGGLAGATYVDKLAAMARVVEGAQPIAFGAETDRVYRSTGTATIHDATLRRTITIAKRGSASTVLWNPWIAKAKAMADFGDAEWPGMLCVETANALDDVRTVRPGETVRMGMTMGAAHA